MQFSSWARVMDTSKHSHRTKSWMSQFLRENCKYALIQCKYTKRYYHLAGKNLLSTSFPYV